MGKDLIIGGASGYTWDQLKYWVNSIQRSGFTGDVVLVATNITKETIDKLTSKGVKLELYGKQDEHGNFTAHSNGAPHVERFFYIWNYLNNNENNYDYVITTDTRDVVFQSNPTHWIDECLLEGYESIITSSEGMKYEDEPWSNNNLREAFGPYFHNLYKSGAIFNVGTIAGVAEYVEDLMFMIFQLSINRPIPIVDQAVFNIIIQQRPYKDFIKYTYNSDAWAIQLGTTIEAVKSGAGDIGMAVAQDPSKMILYQAKYFDEQPDIDESGFIVNKEGKKFVIVHQYDRCGFWKDKIMEKYDD
jgi:hypothetical protein